MKWNKFMRACCGAALALSLGLPRAEAIDLGGGVVVPDAGVTLGGLEQRYETEVGSDIVMVDIDATEFEKPKLELPRELKLKVMDFRITGQQLYPEEKLKAMIEDKKGQLLTFGDLEDLANRLLDFFRKEGYIATRVYIPAQKIINGIVEYTIVVGRYDGVTFDNQSDVYDSQIRRQISFLHKGEYVTKEKLERAVWLLTDLSGADAKATLTTGQGDGTVHLHFDVRPYIGGNKGFLYVDNYGNRYTNYNEYGVQYDVLNLAKQGDHLAFNVLTTGHLLTNGTVNYTAPIFVDGLTAHLGYSQVAYDLGKEYAFMKGTGVARVWRFGIDYAIRRAQLHNLYWGLEYEHSRMNDAYRMEAMRLAGWDRYSDKIGNAAILSLYGNEQDKHGASNWRVEYKFGNMHYRNAKTEETSAAGSKGQYSKLKAQYYRRQELNDRAHLMLVARGQIGSKNLDPYDHISLGGMSGVRAYPQSEGSGDTGIILRAEHRWLLPLKSKHQTLHFVNTFDFGSVMINKDNKYTGGLENFRTLYSTGIGLIWQRPNDWFFRLDYAWRLSNDPVRSERQGHYANGHFWAQGGVYF